MKCPHTQILYHYTDERRAMPRDVFRCQGCFECFTLIPTKDQRPDLEPKDDSSITMTRIGGK